MQEGRMNDVHVMIIGVDEWVDGAMALHIDDRVNSAASM